MTILEREYMEACRLEAEYAEKMKQQSDLAIDRDGYVTTPFVRHILNQKDNDETLSPLYESTKGASEGQNHQYQCVRAALI